MHLQRRCSHSANHLYEKLSPAWAGPEGQKVRIIAVPEFRKTGIAVLLDIATLEPHPLHFDACLS